MCKIGDDWSDNRLIVFTEYRDTHKWLGDMLKSSGVPKERIASMYGGMLPDERSAVAQVFNRAPRDVHEHIEEGGAADLERIAGCDRRVRILLATDTASEGIDCSATATICSTSMCPTTRPGWSSATGASTATASSTQPPTSTRSSPT